MISGPEAARRYTAAAHTVCPRRVGNTSVEERRFVEWPGLGRDSQSVNLK